MDDTAVNMRAVSKSYPNGLVALDQLDLSFGRGTITAVIGNNGSGKTTLLKLAAGLLRPSTGAIRIFRADSITSNSSLRVRIGYVSQAVELDPEMTGAETLGLFAVLFGVSPAQQKARIGELTRAFGLDEHLHRLVSEYSGGLRQRLHLAVGLVHEPELLLLDEPTSALDPAGRELVWKLVNDNCTRGRTVVLVTHDWAEAALNCQRVVMLHRGRLLADGAPETIIAAHANWKLHIESAAAIGEESALRDAAELLHGVKHAIVEGSQMLLDLQDTDEVGVQRAKEDALALLAKQNIAVVSFRLQPPDLASAYRNLAGQSLDDAKSRGNGGWGQIQDRRSGRPARGVS